MYLSSSVSSFFFIIFASTLQCYSSYLNYPLIPSIASTVTNPSNLIEGVAANGWVRGGIPSREMSREKAYASCNYSQGQN